MNEHDIELRLKAVRLSEPSSEFLERGLSLVRNSTGSASSTNTKLAWGLSFALVLSVFANLFLVNRSASPLNSYENGNAGIASMLIETPNRLAAVTDISTPDSVFKFLCLTNSSVIVDSEVYLGELSGFGEWVTFEVPEQYSLSLSLVPLRDWKVIGTFENGDISIELEDGHTIALQSVGLGPASYKLGGPFSIYGEVDSLQETENSSVANGNNSLSATDAPLIAINNNSSYQQINSLRTGIDSALTPPLRNAIGQYLDDGVCG